MQNQVNSLSGLYTGHGLLVSSIQVQGQYTHEQNYPLKQNRPRARMLMLLESNMNPTFLTWKLEDFRMQDIA